MSPMSEAGGFRHLSIVASEHASSAFDRLVRKLRAAGYLEPNEEAGEEFKVLCPIHENSGKHAPSLNVTRKEDGGVLVFCHGGCPRDQVFHEIMADDAVLPKCRAEKVAGGHGAGGFLISELELHPDRRDADELYLRWCAQEAAEGSSAIHEVAHYIYRNEHGREVAAKVKWSNKDFTWLHKSGNRWMRGLRGVDGTVPLYRLDELVASEGVVYCVEGEKDADRLWEDGLIATSVKLVGRSVSKIVEPLVGRTVVVIPDNDPDKGGEAAARRFAVMVAKVGAHEVRLMPPFGGDEPPKPNYDVSDWFNDGGTIGELEMLASTDELVEIIEANKTADSGDGASASDVTDTNEHVDDPETDEERERLIANELRRMEVRAEARRRYTAGEWTEPPTESSYTLAVAATLDRPAREYYIEGIFAKRHIVTLVGQHKSGKTTLAGNVIRSLVDGQEFLGLMTCPQIAGNIGAWNGEMDDQDYDDYLLSMRIKNLDKVHINHLQGYRVNLLSDEGMEYSIKWLRERETEIWIPDPWSKICSWAGVPENDNTEVKKLQVRMEEVRREAGVASIFIPVHPPRAESGADGGTPRGRGAAAIDEWPDSLWAYSRDGDQRFITVTGRNVGLEETAVDFDSTTNQLRALTGTRREVRRNDLAAKVQQLIEEAGEEGIKAGEIYEAIGGNRNSVSGAFSHLEREGKAHYVKTGNSKIWFAGPDAAQEWAKSVGNAG